MSIFLDIYRFLIRLYPRLFRDEFGAEMEAVFQEQIADAVEHGWLLLTAVFLREIRDLPVSLLKEHWQARRRKMASNRIIEEKPLPHREMLAAMIIFVLPLVSILITKSVDPNHWSVYFWTVMFWVAILFALGLAFVKKLPRWALAYLGAILMPAVVIFTAPLFGEWLYPIFIESFGPRSYSWSLSVRVLYAGVNGFLVLVSVLLAAILLVNLLRLLPYTRHVWRRIRADWTQLSFLLYGGLGFAVMFVFDEYQHDELWKFAAWACLALGAWLYLRAEGQKQRILTLLWGATGMLGTVALAQWLLIPLQSWQNRYSSLLPMETLRLAEVGNTILGWGWILLLLLAPVCLNLLPAASPRDMQEENVPV